MFETTGIIDQVFLEEIKSDLVNPKFKVFIRVVLHVLVGIGVAGVCQRNLSVCIAAVVGIPVILAENYILQHRVIKTILARMEESTGKQESAYTTQLTDEGILVQNHSTQAQGTIRYACIIQMRETDRAYLLFTKSWQFTPVFKNELSPDQRQEFIEFLKSKPTKIKWAH